MTNDRRRSVYLRDRASLTPAQRRRIGHKHPWRAYNRGVPLPSAVSVAVDRTDRPVRVTR